MADIKWIKITTDVFDDDKIRLIETMPEGDTLIVIWFKILALAGKQNQNGFLMMNDRIAYTDEMLATIFRRDLLVVRMALKVFEQFGMIEIVDNAILISNWEKHQNVDGMEKIRLQTKERVARHRERLKLSDSNVTCNVTVTQRNATEEDKEKEKEKEEEKKEYIVEQSTTDYVFPEWLSDKSIEQVKKGNPKNFDYRIPIAYLNQVTNSNYKFVDSNTNLVKSRFKESYTLDDFKTVIDKKAKEWLNDSNWSKYLRPSTLFNATKFESYLNQPDAKDASYYTKQKGQRFSQAELDELAKPNPEYGF